MERGKFSLDDLFDRADTWCVANLPVEPVQLGVHKREVVAVDSSDCPLASDGAHGVVGQRVLAPGRAGGAGQHRGGRHPGRVDRWGAGRLGPAGPLWGQLRRGGGRGVRGPAAQRGPPAPRGRCGDCDPEAVCRRHGPGRADGPIAIQICNRCSVPVAPSRRATGSRGLHRARVDDQKPQPRWQLINCKLRGAPPPRPPSQRGRPPTHGAVLHPGAAQPEVVPDEDFTRPGEKGEVRVRRNTLHFEEDHTTILDVVRINDPAYPRPLLIGSTATELTTAESEQAYGHRWPVETNFFVAQDTAAMEMPRAWTKPALERRIGFALLVGGVLKAMAAVCDPLAIGPWDRKPERSAGRLAQLGPPRVEFRRPFPARGSSTKLPQNSKVVSYQGLTGQRGSLNW